MSNFINIQLPSTFNNVSDSISDEYKTALDEAYNKFISMVFNNMVDKITNAINKGHNYTNLMEFCLNNNFIDEQNKISFVDILNIGKTKVKQTKGVKSYNKLEYKPILSVIDENFAKIPDSDKYKLNYYYFIKNRQKHFVVEIQWNEIEFHNKQVEEYIARLGNPRFV